MPNNNENLGRILKQQRFTLSLTLRELAVKSGVSASYLDRIERGERFPSAHILREMTKPLGFDEDELFTLAGFLSRRFPVIAESGPAWSGGQLDPYVASMLAQEPIKVQRAVIGIISILQSLAKSAREE
ncbi:helix-turn-helix domain-containing protein [Chloroflexota bacterium]